VATGVIERRASSPARRRALGEPVRLRLVADQETGRRAPAAAARTRAATLTAARRDAAALTALIVSFCVLGLVMVLSSSSVESIATTGSPWSVVEHQGLWMGCGAVTFVVASHCSVELWRRVAVPFLLATGGMLLAVLVRGIGTVTAGSARWIDLGPLRLQPSEFAKFAVVLFIADLLARRAGRTGPRSQVVRPVLIVLGVFGILIVHQPDLGTAAVIVAVGAVLLCAAGEPFRKVGAIVGLFAATAGAFLLIEPYGRARLAAWLNPSAHASTTGYQAVQSLMTLGSGHMFGTGIGGSPAAWGYLPNANSDFIFAIIGNNFGLVGAVAVVGAFCVIGWLGLRIARRSKDRFASLVAIGVTTWIVVQAFVNIGGVVGVLPETGIPLPFVSAGGSSLVVLLAATGLVVRIARQPEETTRSTIAAGRAQRRPQPER
jgi:cell division protein FtsW